MDIPRTLGISLPSADASSPHDPVSQPHPGACCPVCAIAANASCVCCAEQFCSRHTYLCPDCHTLFCADCLDLHLADGHWSDSDTSAALALCHRAAHGRATVKLPNQPASVHGAHDRSTTTHLAPPPPASPLPTHRDTAPNASSTSLDLAQSTLSRRAFRSLPQFTINAIANFISSLAFHLFPREYSIAKFTRSFTLYLFPVRSRFAFSAATPREANQ